MTSAAAFSVPSPWYGCSYCSRPPPPAPLQKFDAGKSNFLFDNASMSLIALFEQLYRVFSNILSNWGVCGNLQAHGISIFLINKVGRMMSTSLSWAGARGGSLCVTIKVRVHGASFPAPDFDTDKLNLLYDNALMCLVFLFRCLYHAFIHILRTLEECRHHRGNATVIVVIDKIGRMTHSSQWPKALKRWVEVLCELWPWLWCSGSLLEHPLGAVAMFASSPWCYRSQIWPYRVLDTLSSFLVCSRCVKMHDNGVQRGHQSLIIQDIWFYSVKVGCKK